jgi:hypothetical protein
MATKDDPATPVLIIGVGRSGTQLLSWALEQYPSFYNSYENRYVWTYGQRTRGDDRRSAEEAIPRVQAFIHAYFRRRSAETGKMVVDKTPSNVFRVPFIHTVFPEAKILHVIRDGRGNVISRYHEWYGNREASGAHPDNHGTSGTRYRAALLRSRWHHLSEMMRRRNVPPSRWPAFLNDNFAAFLTNMILGRPVRYGERFPGMRDHLRSCGMLATCAAQWREGVVHAVIEGRRLPDHSYLELRYEDLVREPARVWERISGFLGIADPANGIRFLERAVVSERAEKWRSCLTPEQMRVLEVHIRPTLEFLGYEWS